jgi:hypothetical protein
VLNTSPRDQGDGMPAFVVAGVALRPDDERGPLPETRLLVGAAFEAVRLFNESKPREHARLPDWRL